MMYGMADADLGRRIRRARETKRLHGEPWTQEHLAGLLGVSVRSIGRWEREGTVPRSSIGALEQVLGADLTGSEEPDPHEREIRELGTRLGLTPGEQDDWVSVYRSRKRA